MYRFANSANWLRKPLC